MLCVLKWTSGQKESVANRRIILKGYTWFFKGRLCDRNCIFPYWDLDPAEIIAALWALWRFLEGRSTQAARAWIKLNEISVDYIHWMQNTTKHITSIWTLNYIRWYLQISHRFLQLICFQPFATKSKTSKDSTAVPATKVQWTTLAIIPLSPLGLLKQCNGGQVGDRMGTGLGTGWIYSDESSQSIFLKPNPTPPIAKQIGINLESSFSTICTYVCV